MYANAEEISKWSLTDELDDDQKAEIGNAIGELIMTDYALHERAGMLAVDLKVPNDRMCLAIVKIAYALMQEQEVVKAEYRREKEFVEEQFGDHAQLGRVF